MKKQNTIILFLLTVFINSVAADSNIYNQIENDHRIRNFAFIGPFPKDYNADSLIGTIESKTFSLQKSIIHKGKEYNWIKPPASNGSYGFHNVWHYFHFFI